MLWIGLHFHRLPLDALLPSPVSGGSAGNGHDTDRSRDSGRAAPGGGGVTPLAVCDARDILQPDATALALGVRAGQPRATALALAPALVLLDREPARERQALEQLAAWAMQFTPTVSLQPPDGLLLEVAPSLRLFGGLDELQARLAARLSMLGVSARSGIAPTASAAWLFAREGRGRCARDAAMLDAQLDGLPVALLEAASGCLDTLDGLGIRTLAELERLPRPALARRVGSAMLDEIDRARGRRPEPRAWFAVPPVFDSMLELAAPAESTGMLLIAAQRLLGQLAGWLAARQAAAIGCVLTLTHDGQPPTRITLRPADASRDAGRFAALLRERLAVVRLPAPTVALRLECTEVASAPPGSAALFAGPGAGALGAAPDEALARLLERLQARLGQERVSRLRLADDHRPEHAQRLDRAEAESKKAIDAGLPRPPHSGLPRPLWLLREPRPLEERQHRPWLHGPLRLVAGPERIEGGWWDMELVQRDYFVAEDEHGALYWVFRTHGAGEPLAWYLHGRFG